MINNQSEYQTLLAILKLTKELGVQCLWVFTNLQFVAGQVIGEYEVRDSIMSKYLDKVQTFMLTLQQFSIFHIPRGENARVELPIGNFDGQCPREYIC